MYGVAIGVVVDIDVEGGRAAVSTDRIGRSLEGVELGCAEAG